MGQNVKWVPLGTTGGWVKAIENPVLGPEYGTNTACGFPGGM